MKLLCSVVSVEIGCREIESRGNFDWAGVLSREADALFQSELRVNPRIMVARVLILVEIAKPCHSGSFSTHALVKHGKEQPFERMWGFHGFKLHSLGPPGAHRAGSTTQVPRRIAEERHPSKEEQWQKFISDDLGYNPEQIPEWIRFAPALKGLTGKSGHGRRFLDPDSDGAKTHCWTRADGQWPVEGVDWQNMLGNIVKPLENVWNHCKTTKNALSKSY